MSDAAGLRAMTTRPIRYDDDGDVDPADLAAATRVVLGAEAAVLPGPDTSAVDVARMLAIPSVDREGSCLVLDGDEVVGLLRLEADDRAAMTRIDIHTLPWPGSADLRGLLLDRALEVARRHKRESGAPEWKARAGGCTADPTYLSVLASRGMTPQRRFYRMSIDSDSPLIPDVAPPLPEGVRIVPARDDATRRHVHAVGQSSFAEHWGHTDYPYDDWLAFWEALPTCDPEDWWLLTVDGIPAATCMLDERKAAQGEGFIDVLGVLRDYRGRGLATLLLRRAFVHYRELGRRATLLNVDAANATGAVALYQSVGMSQTLVTEAYVHPLD